MYELYSVFCKHGLCMTHPMAFPSFLGSQAPGDQSVQHWCNAGVQVITMPTMGLSMFIVIDRINQCSVPSNPPT